MKEVRKFSHNGLFYFGFGKTMRRQKTLAVGIGGMIPNSETDDRYFAVMACFIFFWCNAGIRVKRGEPDA